MFDCLGCKLFDLWKNGGRRMKRGVDEHIVPVMDNDTVSEVTTTSDYTGTNSSHTCGSSENTGESGTLSSDMTVGNLSPDWANSMEKQQKMRKRPSIRHFIMDNPLKKVNEVGTDDMTRISKETPSDTLGIIGSMLYGTATTSECFSPGGKPSTGRRTTSNGSSEGVQTDSTMSTMFLPMGAIQSPARSSKPTSEVLTIQEITESGTRSSEVSSLAEEIQGMRVKLQIAETALVEREHEIESAFELVKQQNTTIGKLQAKLNRHNSERKARLSRKTSATQSSKSHSPTKGAKDAKCSKSISPIKAALRSELKSPSTNWDHSRTNLPLITRSATYDSIIHAKSPVAKRRLTYQKKPSPLQGRIGHRGTQDEAVTPIAQQTPPKEQPIIANRRKKRLDRRSKSAAGSPDANRLLRQCGGSTPAYKHISQPNKRKNFRTIKSMSPQSPAFPLRNP